MPETTKNLIRGKVAKILNSRELVINRGSDNGVISGMKFKILGNEVVRDPDTDEELGSIEREVLKVKIVDVKPKFAIAQTFETFSTGVSSSTPYTGFFERLLGPVTRVRTIRIGENAPTLTTEAWGFVKVSDRVEELEENEN